MAAGPPVPSALPARVVRPDQVKVLRAFGEEATFHLTGKETGGQYTMFTELTPPGGGPPLHYHEREDEWFHVLEGRVEFNLDGAWTEVPVGTVVFVPRNTVHTFRNPGPEPLRMVIHTAPSGFETFFERCAEAFAQPEGPDMGRVMATADEFGIRFLEA